MHRAQSAAQPLSNVLLLFAVVVFGVAVRGSSVTASFAVILATVVLAVTLSMSPGRADSDTRHRRRYEAQLAAVVALFGALGALGMASSTIGPTTPLLERLPGLIFVVLGVATYVLPTHRRRVAAAMVVIAVGVTLVVGLAHVSAARGIGFDVLFLHVETADALSQGQNPYTDVVEVADGSPNAGPGQVITGYVYPPVTAVSYALGHWLGSDPRYTSLAAWVAVLALLGISAIRTRKRSHLLVMLMLASLPGWPLVLRAAWTEPLSLLFLTVALLWWRRASGSGVGLGLGLASKQYFVVTAPLYLMLRDCGWVRRLVVAFGVVAVTVGGFLIWDPGAFWESAVTFHTTRPPRFDSINLVGLLHSLGTDWAPHPILALAAGLAAALFGGKFAKTPRHLALAIALSLAVSFLVSSQAFANYWFMVFALLVLGSADDLNESPASAESN